MTRTPPTMFLDYTDPISYRAYRAARRGCPAESISFLPFEVAPPPRAIRPLEDPRWQTRRATSELLGFESEKDWDLPPYLPWTRKAHELVFLAGETDLSAPVREALFEAFFHEGVDIGRVDRLVELAVAAGMDRTEVKAVLDIDRFTGKVERIRAEAMDLGVHAPATWIRRERLFEPPYDEDGLRDFLCGP